MTRISIIGMGLIGTSLGLALRSADSTSPLAQPIITGYDENRQATSAARARLAIDREARSLAEASADAEIVVIATPVQAIRALFARLAPLLPAGTIVTDTASTKTEVCSWAADLLPAGVDFIGGHPMAGKEQTGPAAADPALFQGAIYCLIPASSARQQAVDMVEAMVQAVGASPYYIAPEEHDAYVAGISHLPFVLASTLVEATSRSPAWPEMAPLAASGFRDVSRLASGDPTMYRDICMTNRLALRRWIDESIAVLAELREHLEQERAEQLYAHFAHARQVHQAWLQSTPNLRPGEAQFQHMPRVEHRSWLDLFWPRGRKKKE